MRATHRSLGVDVFGVSTGEFARGQEVRAEVACDASRGGVRELKLFHAAVEETHVRAGSNEFDPGPVQTVLQTASALACLRQLPLARLQTGDRAVQLGGGRRR